MAVSTTEKGAPVEQLLTGYASDMAFYASRFRQGGRTVYSLDLSLEQIASLITPPDPERPSEGNRQVRVAHADAFGKYILEHEEWVAPSLILRAPAVFSFDPQVEVAGIEFGVLSMPRKAMGDLHILDGQHRILGIARAKDALAINLDKARDARTQARRVEGTEGGVATRQAEERIRTLERQRTRLEQERMNVQIIIEVDSQAYRQMFFDIADNALGITASVRARFDSRKVVNRTLPLVTDHPLLVGRVDPEGDRTRGGSKFWMGAKQVAEITRSLAVGLDGRISKRQEDELNEKELAVTTKDFLDLLTDTFPQLKAMTYGQLLPADLRKTSLLGSILFIRILAGVYYEIIGDRKYDRSMVEDFFRALAPHVTGPVYEGDIWTMHTDAYAEGDFAPRSRRQDITALKNTMTGWALDTPSWLLEAPAPRPVEDDPNDPGEGYSKFGATPMKP